jgi:hypothetical protein
MASPTKTGGTQLLAIQSLANNTVVLSSSQNVSTVFEVTLFIRIGRSATTALTNPVNIRIQGSNENTGAGTSGQWLTLTYLQSQIATANTQTMSSSSNASGQTTLTTSGSNFSGESDGSLCFLLNGTVANSEFVRLQHVTAATTCSVFDNLVNTQTSSTLYDHADEFAITLNVLSIEHIRVAIDTLSAGVGVYVEAYMDSCTAIS